MCKYEQNRKTMMRALDQVQTNFREAKKPEAKKKRENVYEMAIHFYSINWWQRLIDYFLFILL